MNDLRACSRSENPVNDFGDGNAPSTAASIHPVHWVWIALFRRRSCAAEDSAKPFVLPASRRPSPNSAPPVFYRARAPSCGVPTPFAPLQPESLRRWITRSAFRQWSWRNRQGSCSYASIQQARSDRSKPYRFRHAVQLPGSLRLLGQSPASAQARAGMLGASR